MKIEAYVRSAATLLGQYDGAVPFASWLKEYFRKEKKFGSRDRRMVSTLCYAYLRLGGLFSERSAEERIALGWLLTEQDPASPLWAWKPEWALLPDRNSTERLQAIDPDADPLAIFPLHRHLSREIDSKAFSAAHLVQPSVFLRLRPGQEEPVKRKLDAGGIPLTVINDHCLEVPQGSKVDAVIELDREAIVQDRNSQRVPEQLMEAVPVGKKFTLWDCCAASGGKSILAWDHWSDVQLTASDIRETILHNLRQRFKRAGISNYQSFVADVAAAGFNSRRYYDAVLCDAPCSGSGTWGRTPEQLAFFPESRIAHYTDLQRRIAANAARFLKPGGYLLYSTCSVFTEENEAVVAYLQQEGGLTLRSMKYYKGYDEKADTLFAALLVRQF
ncbi:Fmu (Sun) domain-containing protein [Flaviaesturariibacter amylovorans]|uniref:RsmB/NOP family class I SAM-dependent RNA methyltransferase n=1 Tax=Flaviaesturariibacter amylovorans TaxID=1084520 RepID=A0ABP8GG49_9BACT